MAQRRVRMKLLWLCVCVTEYVWNLLVCVNLLCKSQVNILYICTYVGIYVCGYVCNNLWRYEGVCVYIHTYVCVGSKTRYKKWAKKFFWQRTRGRFSGRLNYKYHTSEPIYFYTYICMPKMHNIVVSMHVCMCE